MADVTSMRMILVAGGNEHNGRGNTNGAGGSNGGCLSGVDNDDR